MRIAWAILAAIGAAWVLICAVGMLLSAVLVYLGNPLGFAAGALGLACIPGWSLAWLGLRLLTLKLHG